MAFVLQVRRVTTLRVLVMRQVPQMTLMLEVPFVLEVIALFVMAPLVRRFLVGMAMSGPPSQFVRMATTWDIAARPVPPMDNPKHRASPPTLRR